jgi:chemotaxis protein CheD
MGELAVTKAAGEVLTTIGLGSCVGLVLLDRDAGAAGLGHVVFPQSPAQATIDAPGRYADTAVPALVAALTGLGSILRSLEAVLVGGARMFSFGRSPGFDIGTQNVGALTQALAAARIPVLGTVTGGSVGRSVRVHGAGLIAVREAGVERRVISPSRGRFEELAVL